MSCWISRFCCLWSSSPVPSPPASSPALRRQLALCHAARGRRCLRPMGRPEGNSQVDGLYMLILHGIWLRKWDLIIIIMMIPLDYWLIIWFFLIGIGSSNHYWSNSELTQHELTRITQQWLTITRIFKVTHLRWLSDLFAVKWPWIDGWPGHFE